MKDNSEDEKGSCETAEQLEPEARGLPREEDETVRQLRRLAEAGYADAQCQGGRCFFHYF